MKHLKLLALAAVAAAAVTAFLGADTASATVLCTTTSTRCTVPYPAGTKFDASLEEGTSAVFESTTGELRKTCTGGTIKGKLANEGGPLETVRITLEEWIWTGCTHTSPMIVAGELEVHHIAGTDNGTLTAKNTKWTTTSVGVSCVYGFGNGAHIGTLTGGFEATIDINAVLRKQEGGFLCPETEILTASFWVTEPKPLFVESE